MLSYEVDQNRLPAHVYEIAVNKGVYAPEQISNGEVVSSIGSDVDARPWYRPYIQSANHFQCPFLPELDLEVDTSGSGYGLKRLYGDYELTPGYFCDSDDGSTFNKPLDTWVSTADNWMYMGKRISVLAFDRMGYKSSNGLTTLNHKPTQYSGELQNYNKDDGKGYLVSQYRITDWGKTDAIRAQTEASYVFKDGHAGTFNGGMDSMVAVNAPQTITTTGVNHMMPAD
ncbi:MAG: hypothetical protein CMJ19_06335 [Phycisphaeraceae bacterium]|nr:hypothetical protein [Phycisphaeraceae bacterium]